MGDRAGSCETIAYASYHGLHVWQLSTDLLHHDGLDGKEKSPCFCLLKADQILQLFSGPIKGVMQTNTVFSRFESEGTKAKLWQVKITYILMQCSLLALGIYKINGMGLLPTTRSDWLAWENERQPLERAYFAFD